MRHIKFRGLRKDSKGWVYGAYVPSGVNPYDIIIDGNDEHAVIASSVGQFTGLTDTNGLEVFEGDCDDDGWFVVFKDGAFMLQWGNNLFKPIDSHFNPIGNIHEQ